MAPTGVTLGLEAKFRGWGSVLGVMPVGMFGIAPSEAFKLGGSRDDRDGMASGQ